MAFARWSPESDVYVYYSTSREFECCMCFCTPSRDEMLAHLQQHVENGDKVPQRCIDDLMEGRWR